MYRESYASAAPFPHIAFDGFFPRDLVEAVADEVPQQAGRGGSAGNVSRCRLKYGRSTLNKKQGPPLEIYKGAVQDGTRGCSLHS